MLTKLKKNQIKRQFSLDDGTETKEIIIVPHKMNPESPWAPKYGVHLTKTQGELYATELKESEDIPLDEYLEYFTTHNCNNELGYYPAFYLKN